MDALDRWPLSRCQRRLEIDWYVQLHFGLRNLGSSNTICVEVADSTEEEDASIRGLRDWLLVRYLREMNIPYPISSPALGSCCQISPANNRGDLAHN